MDGEFNWRPGAERSERQLPFGVEHLGLAHADRGKEGWLRRREIIQGPSFAVWKVGLTKEPPQPCKRSGIEQPGTASRGLRWLPSSDNLGTVIGSFGDRLAADLFDDRRSAIVRRFPPDLHRAARRKLLYLHDAADLRDLRVPPGNRLEALRGRWRGYHSIRINDQWRVVFRWREGNAYEVQVVDYHR